MKKIVILLVMLVGLGLFSSFTVFGNDEKENNDYDSSPFSDDPGPVRVRGRQEKRRHRVQGFFRKYYSGRNVCTAD